MTDVGSRKRQVVECSSIVNGRETFDWNKIWKLKYSPKLLLFIWRLAHNSLPLRTNIDRRGMDVDTRCPVCWRLDEDGGHLFVKCKLVERCWRALNLDHIRLQLADQKRAKEVVQIILQQDGRRQILSISMLWHWWTARNKANAREHMLAMDEVVFRADKLANEVKLLKHPTNNEYANRPKDRWFKPSEEELKISYI